MDIIPGNNKPAYQELSWVNRGPGDRHRAPHLYRLLGHHH